MIRRFFSSQSRSVTKVLDDRLIPLLKIDAEKEVTIYVKGFLTRGENAENFINWRNCHLRLCESHRHRWKPHAMGYSWQTGSFHSPIDHIIGRFPEKYRPDLSGYRFPTSFPVPVVTISAGTVAGLARVLRGAKLFTPAGMAIALTHDVALVATQVGTQYFRARQNAEEHAPILVEKLLDLRMEMPERPIRVVAHSLGSRLVLKALAHYQARTKNDLLIDQLHLLAPGVTCGEFNQIVADSGGRVPGVGKSYLYYSHTDYMMEIFALVEGEHSIGWQGVDDEPENLEQKDVTEYLKESYKKHKEYCYQFPTFAFSGRN